MMQKLEKISLPETIVGENVIIVRRGHEYDEALWNLIDDSREFLREYLLWVDTTVSVKNVASFSDVCEQNWQEQKAFEFVFLNKNTRKLIGAGGFHPINYENKSAEYGYYLGKAATGHGYASEVVRLLSEIMFEKGAHRLVIRCDAENIASANVAERNGFQLEGRTKESLIAYGQYRDELIYAKINDKI